MTVFSRYQEAKRLVNDKSACSGGRQREGRKEGNATRRFSGDEVEDWETDEYVGSGGRGRGVNVNWVEASKRVREKSGILNHGKLHQQLDLTALR